MTGFKSLDKWFWEQRPIQRELSWILSCLCQIGKWVCEQIGWTQSCLSSTTHFLFLLRDCELVLDGLDDRFGERIGHLLALRSFRVNSDDVFRSGRTDESARGRRIIGQDGVDSLLKAEGRRHSEMKIIKGKIGYQTENPAIMKLTPFYIGTQTLVFRMHNPVITTDNRYNRKNPLKRN